MHELILDRELNVQMCKSGHISFPLLNADEIEFCQQLFKRHSIQGITSGFHVLTELEDVRSKQEIDHKLRSLINPKLEKVLAPFKDLIYSLQIKFPGDNSTLLPHQDWSITNEVSHRSYTLWIPLSNTYPENGGMFCIDGSHNILGNFRGPNVPTPYKNISTDLIPYMKPLPIQAGEALFFDQGLIHYTPDNRTNEARISIIATVVQNDAELFRYFYNEPSDTLEAYQLEDKFWIKFDDFASERTQKPKAPLLFSKPWNKQYSLTKTEFEELMNEAGLLAD